MGLKIFKNFMKLNVEIFNFLTHIAYHRSLSTTRPLQRITRWYQTVVNTIFQRQRLCKYIEQWRIQVGPYGWIDRVAAPPLTDRAACECDCAKQSAPLLYEKGQKAFKSFSFKGFISWSKPRWDPTARPVLCLQARAPRARRGPLPLANPGSATVWEGVCLRGRKGFALQWTCCW